MKSSKPLNLPKQYLQGWVEFYKLRFKVTPDVLIPRPETELLVEEVVNFVDSFTRENQKTSIRVIDIGTGSGNIAISIAKNTKDLTIIATDISILALKVAKQNAKFHGVEDRISFIHSDLLLNLPKSPKIPNILVTNLPYIPTERIPYLDPTVRNFEPKVALDGGDDGFGLYRKLFQQLRDKNIKFRILIGEIDYTHGELAVNEALKFFPQAQIEVKTDLAHKQRVLKINYC